MVRLIADAHATTRPRRPSALPEHAFVTTAQFGNDPAKKERYEAFWNRSDTRRPMVGFTMRGFLPLNEYSASRSWPVDDHLTPEMVVPGAFLEEEEHLLREG